jgi:hypothetical protein
MKTNSQLDNDPFKDWIKEVGVENPPHGLADRVLKQISFLPKKEYHPIISPLGWKFIIAYICSIFFGVLIFVPGDHSSNKLWDEFSSIPFPNFSVDIIKFNFTSFQLSQNLLFGLIAFLTLGIISFWINYKNRMLI